MSKIDLAGETFEFLDALPRGLTVPDCFVWGTNKLRKAHGEAKFYIGTKGDDRAVLSKPSTSVEG